jgi:antirestriction protein ArdC
MSTSSNGSSNNLDLYAIVTDQIIEYIEQKKTLPWVRPWAEAGIPMNLISKRPYRGINLWLLLMLNYEQNYFLTFDQIKAHNGSVLKDEAGHMIIYWSPKKKENGEADPESENGQKKESGKQKSFLRYYKVWNISQTKGLESLLPLKPETLAEFDPILECESIFHKMPKCPQLVHKQQKAYYDVEKDLINMPKRKSFKFIDGYYKVLFHEAVHASGASHRLGRPTITEMAEFGSSEYGLEELIAELGSCYLSHVAGLLSPDIENSAAYIEEWLKVLKNDKRMIINASAQGQKAVDYILSIKQTDEPLELHESSSVAT